MLLRSNFKIKLRSCHFYISFNKTVLFVVIIHFSDEEVAEQDDGVSEKQRFMLSVIAASPPADEDGRL